MFPFISIVSIESLFPFYYPHFCLSFSDKKRVTLDLTIAPPSSLSTVSIDDIESVRHGRQTECLQKYIDESLEDQCFSMIFKGKRKNLDLIAGTREDCKKWVMGLEKVITNMNNLNSQQKSEQYPLREIVWICVAENLKTRAMKRCRVITI